MEDVEFQLNFPYDRRQMTPVQIAVSKLGQALKSHKRLQPDEIAQLQAEMLELPGIEYMNVKVLAAALVLIKITGNITPDIFLANLNSVMLVMDISKESVDSVMRYQEALLRYIRRINTFREDRNEGIQ